MITINDNDTDMIRQYVNPNFKPSDCDADALLDEIGDVFLENLDEHDEPTPFAIEIQLLRDRVFNQNFER
ncbi:hypothetical protein FACS1894120_7050 [Clostridia bacterium]|nr:hypothetical protein FACS1894120_7050 [Clostridia bacterium]